MKNPDKISIEHAQNNVDEALDDIDEIEDTTLSTTAATALLIGARVLLRASLEDIDS